jgi:hypothetical protein
LWRGTAGENGDLCGMLHLDCSEQEHSMNIGCKRFELHTLSYPDTLKFYAAPTTW